MRFQQYIEEPTLTYEEYCQAWDVYTLNEGVIDAVMKFLPSSIKKLFSDLKEYIDDMVSKFGVGIMDIVNAFKNRSVFDILKAFKFNIKLLLKAVRDALGLVKHGLFGIFKEIVKSDAFKKIQSGAMKVDELLNKYPILKKLTGVVIAGLLFYIWMNMSFTGDFQYDFDFSDITKALTGAFSINDLFFTPAGLTMLTLFATGTFTGMSFPWLASSLYNIVVALTYTGFVIYKNPLPCMML